MRKREKLLAERKRKQTELANVSKSGGKAVYFLLSPQAAQHLASLTALQGTQRAAIEYALALATKPA